MYNAAALVALPLGKAASPLAWYASCWLALFIDLQHRLEMF
jgi:hypothetical protein